MKIIIKPTIHVKEYSSVEIEFPSDDMSISDIFDNLIRPALLGIGYNPKSIDSLISGEQYEKSILG